jgi:6-phosphofructokinase 1
MKTIAIMTSGGDAPGMNAHIRAVVRSGIYFGLNVYGIYGGFEGLIDDDIRELQLRDVANIIQRGGTILKSSRSERFLDHAWRKIAFENLQKRNIEGLILCGGNGTFTGGKVLHQEFGIPIIGTPGTIDNDLYGTDYTIGFDTAINTVCDAVDKLRDTADSHGRIFFVEVMGRDAGFIALYSGIGCGASGIFIPEEKDDLDKFVSALQNRRRNKSAHIIMVAEGDEYGGAYRLAEYTKMKLPELDIRVSILGHIQRGGNPTCNDRIMASKLGVAAVKALMDGKSNVMIGEVNGVITMTPLEKAIKNHQNFNDSMLQLSHILAI